MMASTTYLDASGDRTHILSKSRLMNAHARCCSQQAATPKHPACERRSVANFLQG
jgi:hypothetical protein